MTADLQLDPKADDQKLLAQVVAFYRDALASSPAALDYLRQRCVADPQPAIDHFRVGYANRTLGLKLPSREVKAGRAIRGRLQQLGLYRGTGHEHFNGCVVFPVLAADGTGRIVDLYGRKLLGTQLRKGTPLDVYLGDERKGVWNVEALAGSKEVVLCPSVFDALAFWCHGYRNVTCTFGPAALTADHLAAFQEFRVQRVLVVAEALVPKLLAAGIDCFRLQLPAGVDVCGYARRALDPAAALGAVIRQAEWAGKGQPPSPPVQPEPPPPPQPPAKVETAAEPTRTASPLPDPPQDVEAEVKGDEAVLTFGNRRYRVRGWRKSVSYDVLKVNVLVSNGTGTFVDTLDLYAARHRRAFVVQAAQELRVEEATVKNDLGRLLLKLEELQDRAVTEALKPPDAAPPMSEAEKEAALELLRDPNLLDRVAADCDLVGEGANAQLAYLAAVSRKLDRPLAVVVQSASAAGKTSLLDAVLTLLPPEDVVRFSAVTGQSLYYMGHGSLKHKVLALVEEEGASRAAYALKLLQSEGELRIASTAKESGGRLVTQEHHVEGPAALFLTTTSAGVDDELLNRCLVLTVNEDREQTRAIHQRQRLRQTLPGLLAERERDEVLALHRNAQRLLRPLLVVNPHAESLTFHDGQTRSRRDHQKYLTLIRAVTLLHQHQRPVQTVEHRGQKVEYVEVTPEDIDIANRLAAEVLGRSLDELPPQTRRLLGLIDGMVAEGCERLGLQRAEYRFRRRDVRAFTGWGATQVQLHVRRLVELEYLLVHRGSRGRSFVYELLGEAEDASGLRCNLSGCCRPPVGLPEDNAARA
jgi:hypothetical protein